MSKTTAMTFFKLQPTTTLPKCINKPVILTEKNDHAYLNENNKYFFEFALDNRTRPDILQMKTILYRIYYICV